MTKPNLPETNTLISWMYRDASNYKACREQVLEGSLTSEEKDEIRNALEDGLYFVPGQIGLDDLQDDFGGCESYWDPDQDHVYHELTGLEDTGQEANRGLTARELLDAFRRAASKGWDPSHEPAFYGTMQKRWEDRNISVSEDAGS